MVRWMSIYRNMLRLAKNTIIIQPVPVPVRWGRSRSYFGTHLYNDELNGPVVPRTYYPRDLLNRDRDVTVETFVPCSMKRNNIGGASFVEDLENPTCQIDNHGRKYLAVIFKAMYVEGYKAAKAGAVIKDLQVGASRALQTVRDLLWKRLKFIYEFEEIAQVGTTAANGDKKIGELIATAVKKVGKRGLGKRGLFMISDEKKPNNELEFVFSMKMKGDFASHFFVTNKKKKTAVFKNPFILIHENEITNKDVVMRAIRYIQYKRPLLIVAEHITPEVAGAIVLDDASSLLVNKVCIINPHSDFEDSFKETLLDLAILTGGQVITGASDVKFIPLMLGSCKEVTMSNDERDHGETTILGGFGDVIDIRHRGDQRVSNIDDTAIIKVGGFSRADVHERNKVVDNALLAAKVACKTGVLPGGGVALLHASKELNKLKTKNSSQKIGVQLVQNALKMPVYTIASIAGFDGSVVVKKLLEQDDPNLGFNPATGEYVNMIESGNADPTEHITKELEFVKRRFRGYHFRNYCWD